MKFLPVYLAGLKCLLLLMMAPTGFCIDCRWATWGGWSECNPCARSQTRSRVRETYAQFGGLRCSGEPTQSRPCETTQGCPLEQGCGDKFACRSGMCIARSLVCNGDQDCEEDNLDEHNCGQGTQQHVPCGNGKLGLPPNIELTGKGYDIVSGKPSLQAVINTKSFSGQCRITSNNYRLPQSTINVNTLVEVKNGYSEDSYESKWHYAKDIESRQKVTGTTEGFRNYDYHEKVDTTKETKLLVLENDVEVGQFQNTDPKNLPLSEAFWKMLAKLPNVYDYAAYREVLQRFGTHYLSEGSLGGSFRAMLGIDKESYTKTVEEKLVYDECTTTTTWILWFPIKETECDRHNTKSTKAPQNWSRDNIHTPAVEVKGGSDSHITALQSMTLDADQSTTWQLYSQWAASVRDFPQVIKHKLRPLFELVKDVQCAEVKKHYLRRAVEQYQAEYDSCHCRTCRNNGLAVMDRDVCKCVCKKGRTGDDCSGGTDLQGQPGVIDGSWACWSRWTACSGRRRSRTRSCSNPAPQNGGQHCIGEPTETSNCEDQEHLEYLKIMEPQCFDLSLERERCGAPPTLINGYILDPKDVYLVGNRVEYTCADQYNLAGTSVLECTADHTWSGRPGICTLSKCRIGSIKEGIVVTPRVSSYDIGTRITLSCPEGRHIRGERQMICDASLNFSPDPANTECSVVITEQDQQHGATVQCKAWEKPVGGTCICKLPYECGSSLEVCARNPERGTTAVLSVCKMHALQCNGKAYLVAENSACQWRERASAQCTSCSLWETCDDQTGLCRCKDTAECSSSPGLSVCVRVGGDAATAGNNQTMSECEAGLRRCKGEQVSVMSILTCGE